MYKINLWIYCLIVCLAVLQGLTGCKSKTPQDPEIMTSRPARTTTSGLRTTAGIKSGNYHRRQVKARCTPFLLTPLIRSALPPVLTATCGSPKTWGIKSLKYPHRPARLPSIILILQKLPSTVSLPGLTATSGSPKRSIAVWVMSLRQPALFSLILFRRMNPVPRYNCRPRW